MAAIGRRVHALNNSARWLGGGAVALLHLLLLLAFLAADRLTRHGQPEPPPITLYRVPDTAKPSSTTPSIGAPGRRSAAPSARTLDLSGPTILIAPDQPLPFAPRGLDLTIHPDTRKSLDDLAPPSREKALKRFFLDSAEENRQTREPSAGEDCQVSFARDRNAASLGESPFKDPMPLEDVCTARRSAKDLARRNERFSPP